MREDREWVLVGWVALEWVLVTDLRVRVAKAGDAISTAESTTTRFARSEDTLIHLVKKLYRQELRFSLITCLALRQAENRRGRRNCEPQDEMRRLRKSGNRRMFGAYSIVPPR